MSMKWDAYAYFWPPKTAASSPDKAFMSTAARALITSATVVPRIGFRRTRTQSAAADGTQCNGTRTRWLFELQRCRSLIEAVRGNLRTNRSDCYPGPIRVRVRVPSAAAD